MPRSVKKAAVREKAGVLQWFHIVSEEWDGLT